MPVILRLNGYRFEFFSLDTGEPPHVHVRKSRKSAKFWLQPFVRLARNGRFRPHELKEIEKLVIEHREMFIEAWNEFFNR